jgi:molybdenum cofactor cytidylyltransferase
MLSSLVTGLDQLGDVEVALSWPVDHPFVLTATAAAVLAASSRDAIVVPTWRGRGGHPTSFGAAHFPALRAAVSARDVIAAAGARVHRLAVDDAGVARDVDTLEDLA